MKIIRLVLFAYILVSCKSKNTEIGSSIEFVKSQNIVVINYINNSENAYFINRSQPYVKPESIDNTQNPELVLNKVMGFQDAKTQEYLNLFFLIAQSKNGFGISLKKDLEFYYSLPNNIYKQNKFILLPPKSKTTHIYTVENFNKGKITIINGHLNLSMFTPARRKAILDFYKISKAGEFQPFVNDIEVDSVKINW